MSTTEAMDTAEHESSPTAEKPAYVQVLLRSDDGTVRPMDSSPDGTITLMSTIGDFPMKIRPLGLNIPKVDRFGRICKRRSDRPGK